jgi:hypothetical protein
VRDNPPLGKKIKEICLPAGASVKVQVIVVGIFCPFNPAFDDRSIRECQFHLCGIAAGIEVDQVGKSLGTEGAGSREGKDKKDTVNNIALTRTIWSGYYSKTGKKWDLGLPSERFEIISLQMSDMQARAPNINQVFLFLL